jgi:HK97 family phage major capsid protein
MLTLQEIIARLAAIATEMRALYDEAEKAGQDLAGENLEKWNALTAERVTLQQQEQRARLRDELDRNAPARDVNNGSADEGQSVFGLTREQRTADYLHRTTGVETAGLSAGRVIAATLRGDWRDAEAERRVMGTVPGAVGGFMMPEPISANLIDLARNETVLIQAGALTIPMASKNLRVVKIATDPTAQWRGEGDTINESDGTFEAINLTAHSLAALVRVNAELMDDVPMFAATLDRMLAASLALKMDYAALYGTGVGMPLGLRGDPNLNEVSMGTNGAAPADYDKWLDAMYEIEADNGNPTVVIQSPRTRNKQRKLVTGITSDLTKLSAPADFTALRRLKSNQISIAETQGSASTASTDFFGGFDNTAFAIRQVVSIEASRVSGTAFDKNQVLVRAIARADFVAFRGNQLCRLIGIL